jgi:hypothetical protein
MRIEAEAGWKLPRQAVRRCVDVARNALQEQANLDGAPIAEYACTLLGICIRAGHSQFVQIGDGAIVIRSNRPSAKYEPVFWPDQGEYANTTRFLTDEGGRVLLRESISVPEIGEVALFSDGLQRLALEYETKSAFGPFFDTMFSHLHGADPGDRAGLSEALSQFLDSDAVNRRTDDDKTLVLATRLEEDTDASTGS